MEGGLEALHQLRVFLDKVDCFVRIDLKIKELQGNAIPVVHGEIPG